LRHHSQETLEIILPIFNSFLTPENLDGFIELLGRFHAPNIKNYFLLLEEFKTIEVLLKFNNLKVTSFLSMFFIVMGECDHADTIKFLYHQFIDQFKGIDSNIFIIQRFLNVENQTSQNLNIDRIMILSFVRKYLEINQVHPIYHFLLALFHEKFPFPPADENLIFILNKILDYYSKESECDLMLIVVFNALKLNAYPCLDKAIKLSQKWIAENNFYDYGRLSNILEFSFLLCKHFGEEMEKYISYTNFIEFLIPLTKKGLKDIPGIATRILLELCDHKSTSLALSISKIPLFNDKIESM
jgi:hypothetical protein